MRALSGTARTAIQAQNTDAVFLACLIVDHPNFITPYRFVNNTEDVIRTEGTYIAWPFNISLPVAGGDSLTEITITLDNVDTQLGTVLGGLVTSPTATVFIVLSTTPNTIEVGPFDAKLRMSRVPLVGGIITGSLQFEDLLNESWPYETFIPETHPGLFQ